MTPTLQSVFSFSLPIVDSEPSVQPSHTNNDDILRHELFEACVDLLSRYTFGMCSSVPQRTPLAEFLLDRSQTCTWLLGQRLITITTTICSSRAFHKGLCESCFRLCKTVEQTRSGFGNERSDSESEHYQQQDSKDTDASLMRRRHKSDMHSIQPKQPLNRGSYDDSHLEMPYGTSISGSYCNCWCQGWAEIYVRRPTGNTSWMMRIENTLNLPTLMSSPDAYPDIVNIHSANLNRMSSNLIEKQHITNETREPEKAEPVDIKPSQANASSQTLQQQVGFRRISSSPEIEQTPSPSMGTSPIEVGQELTAESKVATSPDATSISKLARTASLGKTDLSNSKVLLTRAASFSSSKTLPLKLKGEESDENCFSEVDGAVASKLTQNKPLNLSFSDKQKAVPSPPTSPTKNVKSSPKQARDKLEDISEKPSISYRIRSSTVSDMGGLQRSSRPPFSYSGHDGFTKATGLHPQFVFLQLLFDSSFGSNDGREEPILLPKSEMLDVAIRNFDQILPYETHKIGVIYVGAGQNTDKTGILSNEYGSSRYSEMLKSIGNLIRLNDVKPNSCFLGGLSQDGSDGKFTYCWQDNLTQVAFHVATLMPHKKIDPCFNDKMKHIGNNFIWIVYNDSGKSFDRSTLKVSHF